MLTIFAYRPPQERDRIYLYICDRHPTTGRLHPITLTIGPEPLPEGDISPPDPSRLHLTEAQRLVEDLWQCGIRSTAAQGSVGQLDAVQAHLKDLQRLVFTKDGEPR